MSVPGRSGLGFCFVFVFNDTATTEIYTLSLHDALPIFLRLIISFSPFKMSGTFLTFFNVHVRSEEHTSELQSRLHLVCRLLLDKQEEHHSLRPAEESRGRSSAAHPSALSP